jgi:hypothetical protein
MKLFYSVLLLLAAVPICVAQGTSASLQATPSLDPNPKMGIVNDEAMSRAVADFAAAAATRESQKTMDRINQADCPVVLTSAGLTPYLMLLHTSGETANNGGLDLEFRNASGKEIRSMEFSAEILVKKSIYDLDPLRIHLHLTAYGTASIDKAFAQFRHLSLPQQIHPSMVERLTLEQVTFVDGSIWTSRNDSYCGFAPSQTLPVAR